MARSAQESHGMNVTKDQLSIPLPPNLEALETMRFALNNGNAIIASKGTNNHELWCHLVESGHMAVRYCPRAWGCYQFSVTDKGRESLQEKA